MSDLATHAAARPIAWLILTLIATGPAAAAPTTYHDVYQSQLAERRQSLVEGYKQFGVRNPAWDEKVIAFLEASALHLATIGIDRFYWPQEPMSEIELHQSGTAIEALGCNDPVFQALMFRWWSAAQNRGQFTAARASELRAAPAASRPAPTQPAPTTRPFRALPERLKDVQDRLLASKYDPALIADLMQNSLSRVRLLNLNGEDTEGSVQELHLAACKPGSSAIVRRRLVALWGERSFPMQRATIHNPRLAERIQRRAADVDPWVVHCLLARHLIEQTLLTPVQGRRVMSPLEKKEFDAKVKQAVEHLQSAMKLEPTLPEPYADMIIVSGLVNEVGDPLDWFGRTLEIQGDYTRAYTAYRTMLTSKPGDNAEGFLELAGVCLVQPRYDTLVPWQYIETIRVMAPDPQSYWMALDDEKIYANVVKVLDGYIRHGVQKTYYQSVKAAVAYKSEKSAECRKQLDEIIAAGNRVDPKAFGYLAIPDSERTISRIFLETGKEWPQVSQTLRLLREKNSAEALKLVREVQAKVGKEDPQFPALSEIAEDVEFHAGEWVTLPNQTLSVNGARFGFEHVEGSIGTIYPRGVAPLMMLRAHDDDREKYMVWNGTAGNRVIRPDFEMSVHLHFDDGVNGPRLSGTTRPAGEPVTLGVLFFERATRQREYALVDFGKQRAGFATPAAWIKSWDLPIKFDVVLTVRCVSRQVTMTIDGKPVGEPHELGDAFLHGFDVGIGGIDPKVAYIREIRVRNVKDPS